MFSDSPNAVDFVASINLLVSELHDEVIDQRVFRLELSSLLNNIVISDQIDVPQVQDPKLGRLNARSAQWIRLSFARPVAA